MSSKLKLAQLFSAGLEDDTQDFVEVGGPEVVEEVISQVTDAETAAEEEVVEVTEEVSETVEQQEDLEEVAEALEAFADFLDHASAKGGLGKTAAYAVGMGIEGHLDRIGMSLSDVMPGIESFGNEADKSESTKSFGSKVRGVIATIWEAIVKFTNTIIAKIAEMYQRLKNWSPLMQRKAAALQKAVKELKEDPSGKDVKLGSSIAKKLFMGADATVDLDAAHRLANGTLMALAQAGSTKDLEKIATAGNYLLKEEDAMEMVKDMLETPTVGGATPVNIQVPEGYVVIAPGAELPGGKTVAVVAKQKDGKPDYRTASAQLRDVHPGASEKLNNGVTIKCPNKGQLEAIATAVGAIAKNTDKLVKMRQASLASIKGIADRAKAGAAKVSDDADKDVKENATQVAALARVITKNTAQVTDIAIKHLMGGVGKGLLEAVAQCVKTAGGEAPADDGKKEDGKKEKDKA